MSKYEFTGKTKMIMGHRLQQIRALIDICGVSAGNAGGWIEGESNLSQLGNCWVCENARVYGDALVYGDARVYGNAWVYGNARVCGDALVYGNARVYGDARVCGDALVLKTTDYLTVGPIGSRNDTITFYKAKGNGISVTCGCFSGTISNFEKAVNKTHGDNKHGIVYRASIVLAKAQIEEGRK